MGFSSEDGPDEEISGNHVAPTLLCHSTPRGSTIKLQTDIDPQPQEQLRLPV
jgi:hypothetical protein